MCQISYCLWTDSLLIFSTENFNMNGARYFICKTPAVWVNSELEEAIKMHLKKIYHLHAHAHSFQLLWDPPLFVFGLILQSPTYFLTSNPQFWLPRTLESDLRLFFLQVSRLHAAVTKTTYMACLLSAPQGLKLQDSCWFLFLSELFALVNAMPLPGFITCFFFFLLHVAQKETWLDVCSST